MTVPYYTPIIRAVRRVHMSGAGRRPGRGVGCRRRRMPICVWCCASDPADNLADAIFPSPWWPWG